MINWKIHHNLLNIPKDLSSPYYGTVYFLEWDKCSIIGIAKHPLTTLQTLKRTVTSYGKGCATKILLSIPHVNYHQNRTLLHRQFKDYRQGASNIFNLTIKEATSKFPELHFNIDYTKKEANAEKLLKYMQKVVLDGV